VIKFNNTDILQLIVHELNYIRNKTLKPIQRGGYVGFINLVFSRSGDAVRRYVIYRDHGKGGFSPVTKGIIALQRLYATYDSDCYWIGHSHTSVIDPKSQWTMGVTSTGKMYQKPKLGIITPGYNRNFEERTFNEDEYYRLNFAEERFSAPTGIGFGELTLDLTGDIISSRATIV